MRLTPTVIFVILFNNSLANYFAKDAPEAFFDYSKIPCQNFWWSALLHLQTLINPKEICLHTTWYLSVEWQVTIFISPVLIYLISKYGKNGVTFVEALVVMSSLYAVWVSYKNKFIVHAHDM
jgi:peptidoglycan/LPS O-acetylase OafA/YrhL